MNMRVDGGSVTYQPTNNPTNVKTNPTEQAPPQTPSDRTDTAYTNYQNALKHRTDALAAAPRNAAERAEIKKEEDAKVAAAKKELDAAVADEIGPRVDQANSGVPPQYQRPAGDLVKSYGNTILERHANDPDAQKVLGESIDAYKVQRQADDLIPSFSGDFSAKEKLDSLGLSLKGKPPEVVKAVMADPRVQQWVKDAADHIGEPYKDVKGTDLATANEAANESAKRLAETTEGLPPELAAEVVKQSMPTIENLAKLNPTHNIMPFNAVYTTMSRLGNSPEAQGLMSQVAGAYASNPDYANYSVLGREQGAVYGAASLTTNPTFAVALADQLRARGQNDLATEVENQAAGGISGSLKFDVNSPKVKFDKAHEAVLEKDKHLAQLLSEAGPLSDKQQIAFIKAYREDPANAAVYKAEIDAGKALAEDLQKNKDAYLFAAARDPEMAQQLYDGMKALTDSGQGKTALEFALTIQKDPNSDLAKAFDRFPDFKTDFTEQAVVAASSQLLAESGGDPDSAIASLEALFKQYGPDWSAGGVMNLKDGFEAIKMWRNGDYDRLEQLTQNFNKASPLVKGLTAAGIVFGAYTGSQAANQGDYAKAVNSFATSGQGAAKLTAAATKSLADAGKLAQYGDSALSFATFSSKFAPGFAIAANTAAAVSDGGKLFGDGNASYALSFIGDVVGVIGSALEFTPAAPVGLLLQGVGAVLQIAGGIVTGHAEEKAFKAEENKYLEAAGIDSSTRNAMIEGDRDQVKALLATGMTPEQIQDLAKNDPKILQSHHGEGPYVGGLPDLMKRTGLSGDQLYQMLKAADAGGKPGEGLNRMTYILGHPNFFPEIHNASSKADLISELEKLAKTTTNEDQAKTVNQAVAWLRSH